MTPISPADPTLTTKPLRVLALDLATVTGWALHSPGMQRPHFGAWRLEGSVRDIGRRAEHLRQHMNELRTIYGDFSHMVFEAQHVSAKMDIDTVYCLMALGGMAEWFAFRVGAKCFKVHISQWRKHFLGRGSSFKDKGKPIDPKELALRKCAEHGWHMNSTDAAEACGILDYFLSLIEGYERPWRDAALLGGMA